MKTVALKLLEREDINVNQEANNKITAIGLANKNAMTKVVENINKKLQK